MMKKYVEWFIFWTGIVLCTGLIIFPSSVLGERSYSVAIIRFFSSITLILIGACMSKQRYWEGYADGCREIKITTEREVEKTTRHLRQENKDLQDTIFTHEAVIRELEKNAGCYDGEDGE